MFLISSLLLYASWKSVQAWTVGDLKNVGASGNANENQHFLDYLTSTRVDPSSKMQVFISETKFQQNKVSMNQDGLGYGPITQNPTS